MLIEMGAQWVAVHSDSQLLTQQVVGTHKIKNKKMAKYAEIVQSLKTNLWNSECGKSLEKRIKKPNTCPS